MCRSANSNNAFDLEADESRTNARITSDEGFADAALRDARAEMTARPCVPVAPVTASMSSFELLMTESYAM